MRKVFALVLVAMLGTGLAASECGYSNEQRIDIHDFVTDPGDILHFSYNAVLGGEVSGEAWRITCHHDLSESVTLVYNEVDGQTLTLTQGPHVLNALLTDSVEIFADTFPEDGFGYEEYTMNLTIQAPPGQWDAGAGSYTGNVYYQVSYF